MHEVIKILGLTEIVHIQNHIIDYFFVLENCMFFKETTKCKNGLNMKISDDDCYRIIQNRMNQFTPKSRSI